MKIIVIIFPQIPQCLINIYSEKKRIEDANINIIRLKKELDNFKLRLIELETSDDIINFNL